MRPAAWSSCRCACHDNDPSQVAKERQVLARGLSRTTAVVTGASRRFGRAIAGALARAGAHVVGVARDSIRLEELAAQLGGSFTAVPAGAPGPVVAGELIDRSPPGALVLNAGVTPLPRPVQQHTWATFGRTWEVDVAHVFHWTREALLRPLDPGSVVGALSSGAALFGSPLPGGHAGGQGRHPEADRLRRRRVQALGIKFVSLLLQLTPPPPRVPCSPLPVPPGRARTWPPPPTAGAHPRTGRPGDHRSPPC
jgi:hypothetical protein